MSVYIDNFNAPFGRMRMCHMVADTTAELLEMATRIGVAHKWLQDAGEYSEHFDVCLSKKAKAVAFGAIEITPREFARICGTRPNAPDYIKKIHERIDKPKAVTIADLFTPGALSQHPDELDEDFKKRVKEKYGL